MIDKMNQHKSTKYKLTVTQFGKGKIYHTSLMIFCGANCMQIKNHLLSLPL